MVSTTTLRTITTAQPPNNSNLHRHTNEEQRQHQSTRATPGHTSNVTVSNVTHYQRTTLHQPQGTIQNVADLSATTDLSSVVANGINSSNTNKTDKITHKGISTNVTDDNGSDTAITFAYQYEIVAPTPDFNGHSNLSNHQYYMQSRPEPSLAQYQVENCSTTTVATTAIANADIKSGGLQSSTPTATTVNLSQSLLSSSLPQLNDQISQLFPKCRPRHKDDNANCSKQLGYGGKRSETPVSLDASAPPSGDQFNINNNKLLSPDKHGSEPLSHQLVQSPVTKTPVPNYYKNINIITQSPPPPSTSSISSESLSSVTPRISTNPFLSHLSEADGLSVNSKQARKSENEECAAFSDHCSCSKQPNIPKEEEELPVPPYPTEFYYHTETRQQKHPQNHSGTNSNSHEMPRKRSTYVSHPHSIHQQQQRQEQQPIGPYGVKPQPIVTQAQKQLNNCNTLSGDFNQNPFIKDTNCWNVRQSDSTTALPTATNPAVMQMTVTSFPEAIDEELPTDIAVHSTRATAASTNRSHPSQQHYANADMHPRSTISQQQHYVHLNRSPNKTNAQQSLLQKQQQRQPSAAQLQSMQENFAKGLKPLMGRYLYGYEPDLNIEHQHQALINANNSDDWSNVERGDKTVVESEVCERERKQRKADYVDWGNEKEQEAEREREYYRDPFEMRYIQQLQLEKQQQQVTQSVNMPTEGVYITENNAADVVIDDFNEKWQNLKVSSDPLLKKAHGSLAAAEYVTAQTIKSSKRQTQQHKSVNSPLTRNGEEAISQLACNQEESEPVQQSAESNNDISNHSTGYKKSKRYLERRLTMHAVDTRHGIIEYEGSPRRIGGHNDGTVPNEEEKRELLMQLQQPTQHQLAKIMNTAVCAGGEDYQNVHAHDSPHQQYPVRPGFPQRIISPPSESISPMLLSHNNSKYQEQHSQLQQQRHSSPPTATTIDQNAEDTSNDVSEIGTISDLTTPEVVSATVATESALNNDCTINVSSATPLPMAGGAIVPTVTTAAINSSVFSKPAKSSTFDYLYEFSETRKVLEEFFKCPSTEERPIENGSDIDSIDIQYEFYSNFGQGADIDVDVDEDDDDLNVKDEQAVEDDNNIVLDVETDDLAQHKPHDQLNSQLQQHQQPHQHQLAEQQKSKSQIHFQQSQYQQQQQYLHQQQPQNATNNHSRPNRPANNYNAISTPCNNSMNEQCLRITRSPLMRNFDFFLDSASRSSGEQLDQQDSTNYNSKDVKGTYRYSPDTTDYDSNCDLDSLSGEINGLSTSCSNYAKYYASSMPVLEDGLSSGHTSDTENNNQNNLNNNLKQSNLAIHPAPIGGGISMLMDMKRVSANNSINSMNNLTQSTTDGGCVEKNNSLSTNIINEIGGTRKNCNFTGNETAPEPGISGNRDAHDRDHELLGHSPSDKLNNKVFKNIDPELDSLYSISMFHRPDMVQMTPPPPAPAPHRNPGLFCSESEVLQPTPYQERQSPNNSVSPISSANTLATSTAGGVTSIVSAISSTLNRSKQQIHNQSAFVGQSQNLSPNNSNNELEPPSIPERTIRRSPSPIMNSPVWLPRHLSNAANKSLLESPLDNSSKNLSADEDDIDTDLETDRLLGHQRLDDQGYYDENKSWESRKTRSLLSKISPKQQMGNNKTRNGYNALLSTTPEIPPPIPPKKSTNKLLDIGGSMSSSEHSDKSPSKSIDVPDRVVAMSSPDGSDGSICVSGNSKKNVDNSLGTHSVEQNSKNCVGNGNGSHNSNAGTNSNNGDKKVKKSKNKEGGAVLIEGVLFRAKYLGSTQLVCEGQPTKSTRMMQAEEAVSRIKAPDSDVQPSTEVDLFISTEKIMVLNTDLKEIMMDHALRTISYIADIGDLVVLMARRRLVPQDIDDAPKPNRTPKMICHVFESDEAQFIAQSIGQAFQVAYMEFLKANGIEDHSFVKEMDYQEVLNSQEIFGDELEIFAKKELQKEVVVPKAKGEILGVVIVESGWGSMLPTVVIANLMSSGAAARCGQLNIGDQLIAINGLSLVGLPLSTCQTYIKNTKNQTVVKFTVVPCAPVVEVKIKRPNTKYQLGFSVQNGVICSLLRGGIAERGGVRVGHRIIEINNQSVVAVPHEKIVNLLATSVGEILMKTMPTSMFRLLTGQENPIYI